MTNSRVEEVMAALDARFSFASGPVKTLDPRDFGYVPIAEPVSPIEAVRIWPTAILSPARLEEIKKAGVLHRRKITEQRRVAREEAKLRENCQHPDGSWHRKKRDATVVRCGLCHYEKTVTPEERLTLCPNNPGGKKKAIGTYRAGSKLAVTLGAYRSGLETTYQVQERTGISIKLVTTMSGYLVKHGMLRIIGVMDITIKCGSRIQSINRYEAVSL